MFKSLGKIKYTKIKSEIKVNIETLQEGMNSHDKYFIYKKKDKLKIYNRICDHAGGQLIYNLRKKQLICPIHNWELNPENGKYNNNNLLKKKDIPFKIKNNLISFKIDKRRPVISRNYDKNNKKIDIRFINHAFLIIKTKKFRFATDPWALGPAFNNGWWLKQPSKNDWIDELNNCDFIYISHNHPDHLHPQTLSYLNKNKPIIIPAFISDSTNKLIKDYGFKNIIKLNFNEEYSLNKTNLIITLFKSGDFREDSGIYFSINDFEGLIDVDSNNINFLNLPKVDFYASSFAGGTSGYPIMFENYNNEEKRSIVKKNIKFILYRNIQNIKNISPKYFMPYAGFFEEKLNRDKNIKKINLKNLLKDYEKPCKKNSIDLLNVEKFDNYTFLNKKLILKKNVKKRKFKEININYYLNKSKKHFNKIDIKYIKNYFNNSGFNKNLILFISLTNDNFKKNYINFKINFTNKIKFKTIDFNVKLQNYKLNNKFNYLHLKIRKESFLNTIYNKMPWEDLLIGFQCKVYRYPNVYNADFWFYFTNVYISKKHVRTITNCNYCDIFNQSIDNEISKINKL